MAPTYTPIYPLAVADTPPLFSRRDTAEPAIPERELDLRNIGPPAACWLRIAAKMTGQRLR